MPTDPWSRGVYEYNRNCAGCHGENGEGDEETPPLVGDGAWPETRDDRDATFVTAADAFAYTKAQMPPMDAGSLSDDQYWVILYYVLKENGRALPGTLDASNAADIKLR